MIISLPLLAAPAFGSVTKECHAFRRTPDRDQYITATSQTGSPPRGAIGQLWRTATAIASRVPKLFRKIETSKLNWTSDSLSVFGNGRGPYGAVHVQLQRGNENYVSIRVQTLHGYSRLGMDEVRVLTHLFPGIIYKPDGLQPRNLRVGAQDGEYHYFTLGRRNYSNDEAYQNSARSLLNTLLNDPKNVLGGNPFNVETRYALPRSLAALPVLRQNLQFYGNFGEWKQKEAGVWSATQVNTGDSTDGAQNQTTVSINTSRRTMEVWIQNDANREALRANIRRVIRAAFDSGLDQDLGSLPKTIVSGINGVSVLHLPISDRATAFVSQLHASMNTSNFDEPLRDLSGIHRREVGIWQGGTALDQRDLNGPRLDLSELIQTDPFKLR